ncbi:hemolysin family protein [Acholeplasma vituli]|uniref:Hemolysin family protein n=1 Tax=Paracholeplasma vituli TaxID=69473 RepID=A0ABT2PTT4_9MOLU|nr:hemolysin family protein [Paracholeplasma vituli]MCU0104352.1 hemolysin family protein [Paracholeplasma vituli]
MELPLILLLLVVLLILSSMLSLFEVAIESVNKTKLKALVDDGNTKAKRVLKLTEEDESILTLHIGYRVFSIFGSIILGFYWIDNLIHGLKNALDLEGIFATKFAFLVTPTYHALAFLLLAFIWIIVVLIFGYIVPHKVGIKYNESISLRYIGFIEFNIRFYKPLASIIFFLSSAILKLFKINRTDNLEKVSEEEIIDLIESGTEHGTINEDEQEMISSVLEFNDIAAVEIMTPRTEVYMIDINTFSVDTIDEMIQENYSRIPVYDESPDDIIGVVYIKDVFREARRVGFENVNLRKILHKPYFVPARKKIDALFKELQAAKSYIGILVDEYGGFQGIVTIEDLIEEVMGDIYDEYDDDISDIKEIEPNKYLVNGLLSVEEVNEALNTQIPEDDSYETIAGFILSHIGYIPELKDDITVVIDNVTLKVEKMDDKRIDQVLIIVSHNLENNSQINEEQSE